MLLSWLYCLLIIFILRNEAKPTPAPSRKQLSPLPTPLQRQVQGLKALYDATDGIHWDYQVATGDATSDTTGIPWAFTVPQENPCSSKWDGVNCSSSERITSLSLHRKGLSGTLPSEIRLLSDLTYLDISSNGVMGSLVSQLFTGG